MLVLVWFVICGSTAPTVSTVNGVIVLIDVSWAAATWLIVNDNIKAKVKSSNGSIILALYFVVELKLFSFVFFCFLIFSPPSCPIISYLWCYSYENNILTLLNNCDN